MFIVIGTLLPAGLDFPVPPLPEPFEFVLLQALLGKAGSITTGFAFGRFDLGSSTIPFLEPVDFAFEFQKLWVPPDRILSVGWQPAWKALFTRFGKGLKIVDVIMLGWFI